MCFLPSTMMSLLLLCRARAQHHPITRPLADRIAVGECSSEDVGIGGTFFPTENRTTIEGTHPYFDIIYAQTFKVVINKLSNEQYVLTQCGQPMPTDEQVDEVAPLASGYSRADYIVPVQNYSGHTNEHYGFLSHLGIVDRAVSVVSGVVEPCWQKARSCQYPTFSWEAHFRTISDIDQGVHVPLQKDLSALQTLEYIKFFAVFFNKDAEANQLYTNIRNAFEAAGSGYDERPVVVWLEYNKFYNQFQISQQPYKLDLVRAAGGENFNATALEGLPGFQVGENAVERFYSIDVAAYTDVSEASARLFEVLAEVDAVIDMTWEPNPTEYGIDEFMASFALTNTSSCYGSCKFMQNSMVLRTDGTIADDSLTLSDWLETPSGRPDWAANGLARKLHNDNDKAYRYFRNLALGESPVGLTADMCEEELPLCVRGKPQVIPLLGDGKPRENPTVPSDGNILWYIIAALLALGGIVGCVFCFMRQDVQKVDAPQESLATELAQ